MNLLVPGQVKILAPLAALLLAASWGCGRESSESQSTDGAPDTQTATTAATADREFWEVMEIDGVKVGYSRLSINQKTRDGEQVVAIDSAGRMKFTREGIPIDLEIRIASVETLDGKLLEFQSRISQGSAIIRQSKGRVVGDKLQMETTTSGKTVSTSIPWSADFQGPGASQLSLLKKPMAPGERRTFRELLPEFNLVGTNQLTAVDYEEVSLPGGPRRLLKIDTLMTLPNARPMRGSLWTDESGDSLAGYQQAMNVRLFRVDKAAALERSATAAFDLVLGLTVKSNRRLARPHDTKRIRYRLHLTADDPAKVFPAGQSQQVTSIDPSTAELTVLAVRPTAIGNSDAAVDTPGAGDLKPNNMIQSDDPKIVALAKQLAGNQADPWLVALALEKGVRARITSSNYSQAFDTAAEVVETGEGDCTEHAVLLAALARALGIPARVAIGLVYIEQRDGPAFGYHMWNEVYVADRWVPLDATLARGGIGAAHLKIANSNFEGASAFSSFLPVAQVAGRLQIEIVEVE